MTSAEPWILFIPYGVNSRLAADNPRLRNLAEAATWLTSRRQLYKERLSSSALDSNSRARRQLNKEKEKLRRKETKQKKKAEKETSSSLLHQTTFQLSEESSYSLVLIVAEFVKGTMMSSRVFIVTIVGLLAFLAISEGKISLFKLSLLWHILLAVHQDSWV